MPTRRRLVPTESLHPQAEELELLPSRELVRRLHREDRAAIDAVAKVLPEVARAADLIAAALARGGRLFYVGAGTSGRLGVIDATECPPTFGTDPEQVQAILAGGADALTGAVEGAEDDRAAAAPLLDARRVGPADVVCGISASSTTPFVLGALAHARRLRATTLLVCCNPVAPTPARADVVIAAVTGPELVSGSTRLKAGTATKLVLNALSTTAMIRLGKVYRGRMVDLKPTNRKLEQRARRIVEELTGLSGPRAAGLLSRAGGSAKLAIAMHFTQLSADEARALLEQQSLRELEGAADRPRPAGRTKARR